MIEAALFVALLLFGVALVVFAAAAHLLQQFAVYECMRMRAEIGQLAKKVQEMGKEGRIAELCSEPAIEPERHPADVMGYDAYRQQQIEAAHREYMERTSRLLPCDLKLVPAAAVRRYLDDRRY